jgi:hypothetical protein
MALVVAGTDFIQMPAGTTAQRPVSPVQGMQRYNTSLGYTEVYTGSAWVGMGTQGAPTAVTSLNGQTGAITNTDFGAIGSYLIGSTTLSGIVSYTSGETVSGSIIIVSINNGSTAPITFGNSSGNFTLAGVSGTWRNMGGALGTGSAIYGSSDFRMNTIWCRIS